MIEHLTLTCRPQPGGQWYLSIFFFILCLLHQSLVPPPYNLFYFVIYLISYIDGVKEDNCSNLYVDAFSEDSKLPLVVSSGRERVWEVWEAPGARDEGRMSCCGYHGRVLCVFVYLVSILQDLKLTCCQLLISLTKTYLHYISKLFPELSS